MVHRTDQENRQDRDADRAPGDTPVTLSGPKPDLSACEAPDSVACNDGIMCCFIVRTKDTVVGERWGVVLGFGGRLIAGEDLSDRLRDSNRTGTLTGPRRCAGDAVRSQIRRRCYSFSRIFSSAISAFRVNHLCVARRTADPSNRSSNRSWSILLQFLSSGGEII